MPHKHFHGIHVRLSITKLMFKIILKTLLMVENNGLRINTNMPYIPNGCDIHFIPTENEGSFHYFT